MNVLYFIPRYDPALMGNRIHAEVIHAWRERGVTAEVISLDAAAPRLVTEEQQGIVAHRLPVSAGLPLKLANRAANALVHYPYLAGAVRHYRRFIRERRYDLVHIDAAKQEYPQYLTEALRLLRPGGVVAVNSALANDKVADPTQRDAETVAVREAGRMLRENEDVIPVMIPISDGLLAAVNLR